MTERTTRKLTGLPPWPLTLLTGGEKTGKSYTAAEAAASDLIGDTYWIGVGEDDPDEYRNIEGVGDRINLVPHDGTFRDILAAVMWAAERPTVDGKPNLLVVDSGTKLWDLICDDLQREANRRARDKAEKYHKPVSPDDATITADLWNLGKQRWGHVIDTLKQTHKGPGLITARLDIVSIFDAAGQPTKEKDSRIKSEKTLPFEVGAIVEFEAPGKALIRGVRSLKVKAQSVKADEQKAAPGFTIDKFWRMLGLDVAVGERSVSRAGIPTPELSDLEARLARKDVTFEDCRQIWFAARDAGLLKATTDEKGTTFEVLINLRVVELQEVAKQAADAEAEAEHLAAAS